MSSSMGFEQLCSLFVRGLFDKAQALTGTELTRFQRSRLSEAMTADIRKLGDMAFPAARQPILSSAAVAASKALGHDLRNETWHSQKKIDGYRTFTYEHFYPVRQIRVNLTDVSSVDEALEVLDHMMMVAWITKEEDARLLAGKFVSWRDDPYVAYEQCGIEVLDPRADRRAWASTVAGKQAALRSAAAARKA